MVRSRYYSEDPPQGDGWLYLVTGKNLNGEGPLGPLDAVPFRINDDQCP